MCYESKRNNRRFALKQQTVCQNVSKRNVKVKIFVTAGLFVYKTKTDLIVAVVYVDDAMFFGKNKSLVMKKKQEFMDTWECRDLGEVQEFL